MRTMSSIFNLGFLYSHGGLLYRMDRKKSFLKFLAIKSIVQFFSGTQGFDCLRHFVDVLVSIVFYETTKYFFKRLSCTFSKCNLSLTHCRVNLHSFYFAKVFFKILQQFPSLVEPSNVFVIIFKNASTVSLEYFAVNHFPSTVLSRKSWRTSRGFEPLSSLASLSTYAKSKH